MSFPTKLTISFKNPNKVLNSANSATGYKIYKGERQDPCPDGVPIGEPVVDADITDLSDITFVDNDTTVSTPYFYRISWIRGGQETLGQLLGPFLIPSLYELGYPNNFPSDTSGNPNFVDIEPMFHYNASWHSCFLTAGQDRISLNSLKKGEVTYGLKNHSRRYSSLTQSIPDNLFVGKGIDINETPCFQSEDISSDIHGTSTEAGYIDLENLKSIILDRWSENGLTIDESEIGEVVFDEGVTMAFVFIGASRHRLSDFNDSSSDIDADIHKTGDGIEYHNWHMDHPTGQNSIKLFYARGGLRTISAPKSLKPRLFSTGQPWEDPNPPFGEPDPEELGWMPKGNAHMTGIRWGLAHHRIYWANKTWPPQVNNQGIPTTKYINGFHEHWLNNSLGGNMGELGSHDVAGFRMANGSTLMNDLNPQWCRDIEPKSINIMISTIFPDGTWKFFVNGVLQKEQAPTNVLLGRNNGNGSDYNLAEYGNIWYTQKSKDYYTQSIEDYKSFKIPFQPVPFIGFGPSTTFSGSSLLPLSVNSGVDWCEFLAFPKALDKKNLLRLNNYFQNKYADSISSWHGNYFGY
jgi:hypothetical protein